MFIGHYAAALAIRRRTPSLPLGVLFVAVQLVDFAFFTFVLLDIERLRIAPGLTEAFPIDLHHMPYSHSLVASVIWGLGAGLAWHAWRRRRAEALWLGIAVSSHFLLDVPMHVPDLPLLFSDGPKIGLGLWQSWIAATALETGLFVVGAWLYLTRPDRQGPIHRDTWVLLAPMAVGALAFSFMPLPGSTTELALMSLGGYVLFTWLAFRADRPTIIKA